MKIKNIIGVVALPALLMASAIAFAGANKAEEAKAATDVGIIAFKNVDGASSAQRLYFRGMDTYDALPQNWDDKYNALDENSGVYLNDVSLGALDLLKVPEIESGYYWTVNMAAPANVGDVFSIKGSWGGTVSTGTFEFSIREFVVKWNGSTWEFVLEDYDTVSLADANLPNFENTAIQTDAMGGDYAYVTDSAALPMKKGFFGLTNNTGSYAFQFNYKKTATGTGWFDVLIGGSGPLYSSGHFIDFGFLDSWAETGHAQIHEMRGSGDNWAKDVIQETGAIALGWNVGATNLLEMGAIKVVGGLANRYFIFFKVNGVQKFGEVWDLAEGGMTTKVSLIYNGTDATVSNSIDLVATEKLHTSDGTMGGLYTYNNICPAIYNWSDYFKSVDGNGLKLNGVTFGNNHWNYFKKTGHTGYNLDLSGAGAGELKAGDLLYIGGLFKAAREVNGVKTLFKLLLADSYFQYDGTLWREVNPDYEAADFAKDLLKMTLETCALSDEGNGEALAGFWSALSGIRYYGQLLGSEVQILVEAEADKAIVVPDSQSGIDAMDAEDAIKAAMYRYDFCTAKYNLTPFIAGRVSSLATSGRVALPNTTHNNTLVIVIIVTAASSLCLAGLILFRKRKVR